jgi:hypothetical protein
MEDASVDTEKTVVDSQSTEQTETETSQEDDNSSEPSEETEKTGDTEEPKSKANERIREVIKERNEWKEKYQTATQGKPKTDGIAEDGIDPKAFRESIKNEIQTESAEKNLSKSDATLAREAVRDFDFMTNPIWQEEAQSYVDKGYDPYTAAEMVGQKINYLRGVEKKNVEKQVKADQKLKNNSYQTSGTQLNKTDEFTPEEINAMSDKEYQKNKAKIFKQAGIKANL